MNDGKDAAMRVGIRYDMQLRIQSNNSAVENLNVTFQLFAFLEFPGDRNWKSGLGGAKANCRC